MSKITQPVIKWSGSKRSQADTIVSKIPKKKYDTYFEPFVGGGSVLVKVLQSDLHFNNYICSDYNEDLINLWNTIKDYPQELVNHYTKLWHEANHEESTPESRREYFYEVRARFNKHRSPLDFMYIMRTTTNGMPRYNQKNEFNNSFHITRKGMKPTTLEKIVLEWSELLNKHNVKFIHRSYEEVKPSINDFVYLDPPYANTKGMYFGAIDYDKLWDWLRFSFFDFLLSFDGTVESNSEGKQNLVHPVPTDLYQAHELLNSGNSSFRRVIGKSKDSIVYESLYHSNWKERIEQYKNEILNNVYLGDLRFNKVKLQLFLRVNELGEFDYFELERGGSVSDTLFDAEEIESWIINE